MRSIRARHATLRTTLAAVWAFLLTATAGCASAPSGPPAAAEEAALPDALPGLHATLWVQTGAGYRASAMQTYRLARDAMVRALRDPTWSAIVDGPVPDGSPAVILDVDETVLDNSAYEARRLQEGTTSTPESWAAWVEEAAAPPVPGALGFTRAAAARGIAVYYVTNRDRELEGPTLRNLLELGFPVDSAGERLMTKGERPDWNSDKRNRQLAVAADHRVLLLVADDLNDFVPGVRSSADAYRAALDRYADRFGQSWFMLPNPMYGSWERAGFGFRSGLSRVEQLRAQLEALRTER